MMVESADSQIDLYNRALELYQQGAWDHVIELLVDVEDRTDQMRSLLAAARWQVAYARARQRAHEEPQELPSTEASSRRRLPSWAMPALLVGANLLIYGFLAFAMLAIWQGRSMPAFSAVPMPAGEPSLSVQAEAAIAAQDWESAIRILQSLVDNEPDNTQARERLSYAVEQRRLESLFTQAEGYYGRRLWNQALTSFQNLRNTAPLFRPEEVANYLCKIYVETIRAQITETRGDIGKLLPLRAKLKDFAGECNDDEFAVEAQLLDLYIAGIEAAQLGRWTEAIDLFQEIRRFESDYIEDQIAQQLYLAHANLGNSHALRGEWAQALDEYNTALAFGVPDVMQATALRAAAVKALASPTVTPTATALPTNTATPTATPTAVPSQTMPPTPPATPSVTASSTPTARPAAAPVFRPRPSATPMPLPTPTSPPPPPPPTARPPATQSPPTSTPAPSPTAPPPPTATPFEEIRPPTPTSQPTATPVEEQRPPTPTQEPRA